MRTAVAACQRGLLVSSCAQAGPGGHWQHGPPCRVGSSTPRGVRVRVRARASASAHWQALAHSG